MNGKTLAAIAIVIVMIVGAFYFLGKSNTNSGGGQMAPSGQTPTEATQMQQATGTTQPTGTSQGNNVTIQNFKFAPESLTVKVGDKVTWTNQDSVGHSATADDGSFDTGVLSNGQSGSITFSKAGTYSYHCSVHPMMKGTIVVQ